MPSGAPGYDLEQRLSKLASLLERWRLEALLVIAADARDPDLAPFVGRVHLGSCFLVATPSTVRLGYLTPMERDEAGASGLDLLSPASFGYANLVRELSDEGEIWATLLERAFGELGLRRGRVGLSGRFPAGIVYAACSRLERAGWRFSSGHELSRSLRKTKTIDEVDDVRLVSEAVCRAFRQVAEVLASSERTEGGLTFEGSPLTAGRLRRVVHGICAESGLEQPHGNIVSAGRDAGVPHTQGPSGRQLHAGEAIVVDLYPRGRLFSDCTRTFCVGPAPEELSRAHDSVLAALKQAHELAGAGSSGWDLQQATCELLAAAGYPTPVSHPESTRGYVHGLGHGVGFELHEYPSFRQDRDADGVLAVGDVFTLEPGLYDPEAGYGVRLEDLCYLSGEGLQNLTELPYELDPAAWA